MTRHWLKIYGGNMMYYKCCDCGNCEDKKTDRCNHCAKGSMRKWAIYIKKQSS